MAEERNGVATMKGNPVTLEGPGLKVGQKAPGFQVVNNDLAEVTLGDSAGKVRLISSVASLDTSVCDLEIRRFNEEVAQYPQAEVLTVSMDLPFAQKRWCGAAGVERVTTLSDHRDASFGRNYGVLIKGLRLLARAVFIVDASDTLRYVEIVPEVTDEPDYAAALAVLKDVTG